MKNIRELFQGRDPMRVAGDFEYTIQFARVGVIAFVAFMLVGMVGDARGQPLTIGSGSTEPGFMIGNLQDKQTGYWSTTQTPSKSNFLISCGQDGKCYATPKLIEHIQALEKRVRALEKVSENGRAAIKRALKDRHCTPVGSAKDQAWLCEN